jgi:hypothetical protein
MVAVAARRQLGDRSSPMHIDKIDAVLGWLNAETLSQAHAHHDRHGHGHYAGHDPNRHDERIQTFCLTFEQWLRWDGIGTFLEMLVKTCGENLCVLRAS